MPLIICRAAAKSYVYEVYKAGGFVLVFGRQIYAPGYGELAREVRDVLRLPVEAPRDIEAGRIDVFERWHRKKCMIDRP